MADYPASSPRERPAEVSLFELGSIVIRRRWRIIRWMVVGAVLAVLPVAFDPPSYTSSATFISHGATDPSRDGLSSLVGQFGISLGRSGSPAESPQFYEYLLKSRVILEPLAAASYEVDELGPPSRPFLDLVGAEGSGAVRLAEGTRILSDMVSTTISRETGVLTVSVLSEWPSLSHQLVERLLAGVHGFNLESRRGRASEERRFADERLREARTALLEAENELKRFDQTNRAIINSPDLMFQRERLQREVAMQQQLVTSLVQAFEEARIREVRDTPLITVIEQAGLPVRPNPRGRARRGIMGLLLGAAAALFVTLVQEALGRRRAAGDPEAEAFLGALQDIKPNVRKLVPPRHGAAG